MNRTQITMVSVGVLSGLIGLQTASADIFSPVLVPGDSGLGVSFTVDDTPDAFGTSTGSGSVTVSGGTMTVTGPSFRDYTPTTDLDQGTTVPLDGAISWVFRFDMEQTTVSGITRVFEASGVNNVGGGGDFVTVRSTGVSPNEYNLLGGNGSGSYATLAAGFTTPAGVNSWELFYDGTDDLLDLYVADTLILGNFPGRHSHNGLQDFNFVRMVGDNGGTYVFDNIIASETVIPEPGTLALLVAGVALVLGRRARG